MSEQISQAAEGVAGNAAIGAPRKAAGDTKADAEVTKIDGEWSIKLRIMPPQGHGQQASGAIPQEVNLSFNGVFGHEDEKDGDVQRQKWFKEMRGWLMVLATVAASVTYQAGLNPPGGFWQDDPKDRSHHAGDPALHEEHHTRYLVFYYFNATAFVTSLVIMVLLMSERFYHTEAKVFALMLTTFVDLASLIGAYIAGTTRYFSSCIYIIVITGVSFIAVILIGEVMSDICAFVASFSCMETLVLQQWCPIPKGVAKKAERMKAERKQRRDAKMRQRDPEDCCQCCV